MVPRTPLAQICEQWLLPISPKPLVRIVDFYRAGRGDGASATCSTVIDGHYQWQRALDKLEASKDTAMGPSPLIELTKRGVGKGWMVVRVEPAEAAVRPPLCRASLDVSQTLISESSGREIRSHRLLHRSSEARSAGRSL